MTWGLPWLLLGAPGKHEDYRLNRTDILRRRIDKHTLDLEIGPSHNPVASKRANASLDHGLSEHEPDLIRFMNECDAVMEPDGILTLAVPDKRFCFDRFRPCLL